MDFYTEIKDRLLDCEIYDTVKDYSKERNRVVTYFEAGKLLYEAGRKYGKDVVGEYAKKLILETNYSMTDIIVECGFTSISNFYSKFIDRVGCSPLKFKKINKKDNKGINDNEDIAK